MILKYNTDKNIKHFRDIHLRIGTVITRDTYNDPMKKVMVHLTFTKLYNL
jgi:hypothetical protein